MCFSLAGIRMLEPTTWGSWIRHYFSILTDMNIPQFKSKNVNRNYLNDISKVHSVSHFNFLCPSLKLSSYFTHLLLWAEFS